MLLSRAFASRLSADGFTVDEVATLAEARAALVGSEYVCLILDRRVSDGDSLALLSELPCTKARTPVIVLSAESDADDRVLCLIEGADDFVAKPVHLDELALRVSSLLRRLGTHRETAVIDLGNVSINLLRRDVTRAGQRVHLSPIQYSVLEELARHRHRVLLTEELLDRCWNGRRDPFSNPLHTQISRLRKLLGPELVIKSVRGAG